MQMKQTIGLKLIHGENQRTQCRSAAFLTVSYFNKRPFLRARLPHEHPEETRVFIHVALCVGEFTVRFSSIWVSPPLKHNCTHDEAPPDGQNEVLQSGFSDKDNTKALRASLNSQKNIKCCVVCVQQF